ncbi:hypothetical protein VTK73DRAFT_2468 [Phialemonium thermophilum]|uniref:Uncharacterized protein n=1 Tax=Phialemonium thermophilum TaxID=223376 RepID=A0ABR3VS17_9PEZI
MQLVSTTGEVSLRPQKIEYLHGVQASCFLFKGQSNDAKRTASIPRQLPPAGRSWRTWRLARSGAWPNALHSAACFLAIVSCQSQRAFTALNGKPTVRIELVKDPVHVGDQLSTRLGRAPGVVARRGAVRQARVGGGMGAGRDAGAGAWRLEEAGQQRHDCRRRESTVVRMGWLSR